MQDISRLAQQNPHAFDAVLNFYEFTFMETDYSSGLILFFSQN